MLSFGALFSGFDPSRITPTATKDDTAQAEREAERKRKLMDEAVEKWRKLQDQQPKQSTKPVPVLPDPGPTKPPVNLSNYTLPKEYKKVIILGVGLMLFFVAFQKLK
jgi:hypothetical protein